MSLNVVIIDGVASHIALRYDEFSKPELRWTLTQTEKDWPLYLPCFSPGAAGERLASEIEDGSHVVITSGKLAYRKRDTKAGPQSRLEILVWSIDRLSESPQVARSDVGEGGEPGDEPVQVPEVKVRRPRYPKFRGQPNPN
jgi:hypothetical protein